MKDSVEKWFKDGAKDLNVIPPHEAWENVEKTLEDWPKHWYQSNFSDLNNDADAESWSALSKHLEIRRNARNGYRNFIIRTASIAAAIVLLPLWLANVVPSEFMDTSGQNASNTELAGNSDQSGADQTLDEQLNPSNFTVEFTPIELPFGEFLDPGFYAEYPSLFHDNGVHNAELFSEFYTSQEVLSRMTTRSLQNLEIPTESIMIASALPKRKNKRTNSNKKDALSSNQWFLGPTAILGRSSLLNPLTFRDDVMTGSTVNLAYGISGTRRFNRNLFTADLMFNDVKTQMASLNAEELNTQLNGITFAFQYERVLPIFRNAKKLRPELFFGVGAFTSFVTNTSVNSNVNDSFYSTFTYRNMDFGGVVTTGAAVQLNNRLRLGVGARIQSGAINLFEGREKVPSQLFRTRSLFTGIQVKLSYAL